MDLAKRVEESERGCDVDGRAPFRMTKCKLRCNNRQTEDWRKSKRIKQTPSSCFILGIFFFYWPCIQWAFGSTIQDPRQQRDPEC